MRKRISHNGEKYGRLTIIKDVEDGVRPSGQKYRRVLCKCMCGNTIECELSEIIKGKISSCKCYRHDYFTKHGCNMENSPHKRIYNIYMDMKKRCYNPNSSSYKNYGGRGISICSTWLNDFNSFLCWALNNGYKDNLSIDRINNNGNYEPSKCRWATNVQQANNNRSNKVIVINGKANNLKKWASHYGINLSTYKSRRKRGWEEIESLTTPIRKMKKRE